MKHCIAAVLALFLALPPASANNIKMVTYFPIPYVSYNELGVAGTCDLGLMDGCSLDAGSSLLVQKKGDNKPLDNGALRLKEGSLWLNGPLVSGDTFRAGTDVISNSSIEFKHSVDVKSMTQSVQSLEVTNRAYLGELNLFGETFPKCDNNNSREMNWKRLNVNGKEGVFLVCGAGKDGCTPEYGGWADISSAEADTCDGDASAEFVCGGAAKECVDVKTVTAYAYQLTAGAETRIAKAAWEAGTDTCNGNKTIQASSCSQAGGCVDLYQYLRRPEVNCTCGITGGNECVSCQLSAGQSTDNYCDLYPGTVCCKNGYTLVCLDNQYFKRSSTCARVPKTAYQKRTVKCCAESTSPGGADPQPTCADQSYKLANKKECCPSAPESDADCWKFSWVSGSIDRGQCYTTMPEPPYCDPEAESGVCNASRKGTFTCYQDYCNGVDELLYKECALLHNGW